MKKLVLVSIGILFSQIRIGACFDHTYYNLWRSTDVTTSNAYFYVSSGAIIVDEIVVSSGIGSSTLVIANSTSPNVGVAVSSTPAYDLSTNRTIPVNKVLTKGFGFQNLGTATFRIKWDYYKWSPGGAAAQGAGTQ